MLLRIYDLLTSVENGLLSSCDRSRRNEKDQGELAMSNSKILMLIVVLTFVLAVAS